MIRKKCFIVPFIYMLAHKHNIRFYKCFENPWFSIFPVSDPEPRGILLIKDILILERHVDMNPLNILDSNFLSFFK